VSGVQTREVRPDEEGWRLDRWVRQHFPVVTHGALQKLLRTGQFRVDGKRVEAGTRLAPGQAVRVPPLPEGPAPQAARPAAVKRAPSPEDARFIRSLVVHEEPGFFALNKPAGLAVQGGTGTTRHVDGLLDVLADRGGERPRLVHRLDRDTSGLLVVARSERAHRRLQRLMRDREIRREYVALVHGAFPPALTVDRPIGRDRRVRTRQAIDLSDAGREAVTHLRRLEDLGRFSLVEARLDTGRTHQIRVHLESAGHPVVGDRVYGRREETLGLERQFLHAARLAFDHPVTGERIEIESALPADLEAALATARRR
jgi:RluA family pseudouridine synthase